MENEVKRVWLKLCKVPSKQQNSCMKRFCETVNQLYPNTYSTEQMNMFLGNNYAGVIIESLEVIKRLLNKTSTQCCDLPAEEIEKHRLCIVSDVNFEIGILLDAKTLEEVDPSKDRGVLLITKVVPVLHSLGLDYKVVKPTIYLSNE